MRKTRREFLQTAAIAAAIPSLGTSAQTVSSSSLAQDFASPPDAARPWVYFFWKNGNIRKEGLTADLEAMQRAGIGGFILMEVSLTTPKGPVEFFSPAWRELFQHATREAERLGLQISVSSAPGWTGSGGPWVKPSASMQKITATEVKVTGPRSLDQTLLQPPTVRDFYAEVAVIAYPTPSKPARVADIEEKALYRRGPYTSMPKIRPAFAPVAIFDALPPGAVIPKDRIVDITSKMDAAGRLIWDVPAGDWTIVRFGRTSTGQTNRPSPLEGLECDKLDKRALDEHFREFTAKLVADAGPRTGKTLVATHLDSWEVGAQNWSPLFRDEFRALRGYDPVPWLPAMQGFVIESNEWTERFLWDLRQTIAEAMTENHTRHMAKLAHAAGLWLSIESYDMNPCDDMTLGSPADVPMCEFWTSTFDSRFSVIEAASVAHVYGRQIVAAESFTSGAEDCWKFHPATVKNYGDWAFSQGVNRFVIHRYVHQPFPQIRPGLTLAAHGFHCDRTQTWWEISKPWHTYLARCQYLLQQGRALADILYLSPEGAPNVFQPPRPAPVGYKYDACTPEALLRSAQVSDGRIVFPSGAEYRLLVLPESVTMTVPLLEHIHDLAASGARIIGTPPEKSPGLTNYPECDREIGRLTRELNGKLLGGSELVPSTPGDDDSDVILNAKRIGRADRFRREFQAAAPHFAELKLIADQSVDVRVNGKLVQAVRLESLLDRGNPEGYRRALVFDLKSKLREGANVVEVEAESPAEIAGALILRDAVGRQTVILTDLEWSAPEIGPLGIKPFLSPAQRDLYAPSSAVATLLEKAGVEPDFIADRPLRFTHRRLAGADIYFVSNGERRVANASCTFRVVGRRPELWHPETGVVRMLPEFAVNGGRTTVPLRFEPEESYFILFRSPTVVVKGKNFPALRTLSEIAGPWDVTFDPKSGGPAATVPFDRLDDWSQRPEENIRYYSGTASYRTSFPRPVTRDGTVFLELGAVRELAQVFLNGVDLGVQWKRPFRLDISKSLRDGDNQLEVCVTNLWPNRMIGDAFLPEDSEWNRGRLVRWPDWLLEGKPSPSGRRTFTHIKPYSKDSPLLPSGLLGPVRLRTA